MFYYPVSLDLANRSCIVIGGGKVAERKVKGLLTCGARLTVISPELTAGLTALHAEGRLLWVRRPYREGDLAAAFLVIAATDDTDVQRRIHREASSLGILLNVADVPKCCNFILPATVRRGDLTVAVSTGGKSPALAKQLRLKLEKKIGPEYKILLNILGDLRTAVLADGRSQAENEALFNELIHHDMLEWITVGAWEKIEHHIRAILGDKVELADWRNIKNNV